MLRRQYYPSSSLWVALDQIPSRLGLILVNIGSPDGVSNDKRGAAHAPETYWEVPARARELHFGPKQRVSSI